MTDSQKAQMFPGMHDLLIQCMAAGAGLSPDEVYTRFIALKREVFGEPKDE